MVFRFSGKLVGQPAQQASYDLRQILLERINNYVIIINVTQKQKPSLFASLSQDRSSLILVGVAVLILIISLVVIERFDGSAKLAALVGGAGVWAPLVFILAKALTYVIAPLSGGPIKVIAGALFGFIPGVIYSTLGDLLGASINFWLARLFGREAIHKLFSKQSARKIDDFIAHVETWKTLLAARIVLAGVYDFISYAAGLSKVRYKTFFWVTLIGGIPGSMLAVGFGATILANTALFIGLLAGGLVLFMITAWASGGLRKIKDK